MKPKNKKGEDLDALKKDLADAANLFVAQFQGITVAQDTELRQKIRAANGKYRVVKNTLARIAAKGAPAEAVSSTFEGSTAIAYNNADPVALAIAVVAALLMVRFKWSILRTILLCGALGMATHALGLS